MSRSLTHRQQEMVEAIERIPHGQAFYVRDAVKAGYSHKDGARILQQDPILLVHVEYADPPYDGRGIRYQRRTK